MPKAPENEIVESTIDPATTSQVGSSLAADLESISRRTIEE